MFTAGRKWRTWLKRDRERERERISLRIGGGIGKGVIAMTESDVPENTLIIDIR